MATESAQLRRSIRWLVVRNWTIDARVSARQTCDLLGFGPDASGRVSAALVFAAVFFLAYLAVVVLAGVAARYGLALGLTAFVTVLATSATLILWASDKQLTEDREETSERLEGLRKRLDELPPEPEPESRRPRPKFSDDDDDDQPDIRPARAMPVGNVRREERIPAPVRRPKPSRTQECPYCAETIHEDALKCKHCGEILDERLRRKRDRQTRPQSWSPGVAAVLSFLIPGLGQIYKGQVFNGLFWLVVVLLGYSCILPGLVLHVLCIFGAASGRRD